MTCTFQAQGSQPNTSPLIAKLDDARERLWQLQTKIAVKPITLKRRVTAGLAALAVVLTGTACVNPTRRDSDPQPTTTSPSTRYDKGRAVVLSDLCSGVITAAEVEAILPGGLSRAREADFDRFVRGYGRCALDVPEGTVFWVKSVRSTLAVDEPLPTRSEAGWSLVTTPLGSAQLRNDNWAARAIPCRPFGAPMTSSAAPASPASPASPLVEVMDVEISLPSTAARTTLLSTLDRVTERLRTLSECTIPLSGVPPTTTP